MQKYSLEQARKGRSIGFIPTMGYLHKGHLSLIRAAVRDCDVVVVSIFVNPIQFGPKEDLKKYPRDIERDSALLSKTGVDILFHPSAKAMYPEGFGTYIDFDIISDRLCGALRPGHFRGVATVVNKLFNIVKPDVAYFGLKDYQQQLIIKKMARELDMGIKIISLPTVREPDGLAMSSRNKYLGSEERTKAVLISRSLMLAKELKSSGVRSSNIIRSKMNKLLSSKPGISIDYISVVHPGTLNEKKNVSGRTLIAVAARIGGTRLIDNIEI